MAELLVIAPCSLVAASTSETSVSVYQTTRRNNPEDSRLHTRRHENLKSHMRTSVFWDAAPCSLVDINRRFRGAYCLHRQADDGGSKIL
jgi:hypothetical protein